MATREIRTSSQDTICDVCGRTLLRGEQADVYLNGGTRRSVCELCKDRALHEGWVREGTVPAFLDNDSSADRRRSLLGRLRGRREGGSLSTSAPTLRDELDSHSWSETSASAYPEPATSSRERVREPRHVRAVPTSSEQKAASAVDLFNGSEHRRTVAGVARSLGAPGISVAPSAVRPSVVNVVVSWELCWYRYEVDLSDDQPSIRVAGQGYELSELTPEETHLNAVANEQGTLILR
jgi:hypothetical protein